MRTTLGSTQRATLAIGSAATLALLGLATPAQAASAHHGDRDHDDRRATSLKEGKGHNATWQAQSDPDGEENGGVDQPGGAGGVDTSQQDGNNGSGNDVDCEDDNRGKGLPGHCKDKPAKPAKPAKPSETPAAPDTAKDQDEDVTGPAPQGPDRPATDSPAPAVARATTRPVVLGVEQEVSTRTAEGRAPAAVAPAERDAVDRVAAVLPNTGAEAFTLALFGGGLASVVAGTVLLRRRQVEEA